MPNKQPLISVLMGVYYRSSDTSLLERSIQSIRGQSYSNFELLICDGGSSEEACALCDQLAAQDSRIKLVRDSGVPTHLPHKLNACLKRAEGELIARMDDDDYSHPERFVKQVEFLERHDDLAFVGCNVRLCLDGEAVGKRELPERPQVRDFYFVQPFIHPALIFRREALETVGGYREDPSCLFCEDYDLLLRLYAAGHTGANIQDILLDYSVPATAKGNRRMSHRWNETVTRWQRFSDLGVLPSAFPYVVKPLVVGMIPEKILKILKQKKQIAL